MKHYTDKQRLDFLTKMSPAMAFWDRCDGAVKLSFGDGITFVRRTPRQVIDTAMDHHRHGLMRPR